MKVNDISHGILIKMYDISKSASDVPEKLI